MHIKVRLQRGLREICNMTIFFIYNYSWNNGNKKKKGGKIMGLPQEPSKICSFRKCNIPLLTIIVNCLKKNIQGTTNA